MHPRPHAAPPAPGERAPEVRGTDIPTERGDGLAERAPEVMGTDIPTEKGDELVDRAPGQGYGHPVREGDGPVERAPEGGGQTSRPRSGMYWHYSTTTQTYAAQTQGIRNISHSLCLCQVCMTT